MKTYVRYERYGGTCYGCFEGQDEATILQLLNSLGATAVAFVSESEFTEAAAP